MDVTHPVRPGCLACSKSYDTGLVTMLSSRTFLPGSTSEVSAWGLTRFPSMFCPRPMDSRSTRGLVRPYGPMTERRGGREVRRDVGRRRDGVGDDRREAVPDPLHAGEPGIEPEEGRAGRQADGEPLGLCHVGAVGALVPDQVRLARDHVRDAHRGLQLPGPAEEQRQVDAGVPVEAGFDAARRRWWPRASESPGLPGSGTQVESANRTSSSEVGHADGVPPVEAPEPERRLEVERRGARVRRSPTGCPPRRRARRRSGPRAARCCPTPS